MYIFSFRTNAASVDSNGICVIDSVCLLLAIKKLENVFQLRPWFSDIVCFRSVPAGINLNIDSVLIFTSNGRHMKYRVKFGFFTFQKMYSKGSCIIIIWYIIIIQLISNVQNGDEYKFENTWFLCDYYKVYYYPYNGIM